jgi:hypothetical protein
MFNESNLNKSDYIFIDPLGLHMEVVKKIISCKQYTTLNISIIIHN